MLTSSHFLMHIQQTTRTTESEKRLVAGSSIDPGHGGGWTRAEPVSVVRKDDFLTPPTLTEWHCPQNPLVIHSPGAEELIGAADHATRLGLAPSSTIGSYSQAGDP